MIVGTSQLVGVLKTTPLFYKKGFGDYMVKENVNDTVKRRFKFRKKCPICGKEILETDDFQYCKYQSGRLKPYVFFHTACLRGGNENAI